MEIPDGFIFELTPKLTSVVMEEKPLIKCKHCKYYEADVWGKMGGVEIIMAHNACTKWNYSKTDPEGYCHMAEKEARNGDYREES